MRLVISGIKWCINFVVITNKVSIGMYFQLVIFLRVDDDTLVSGSLQIFTKINYDIGMDLLRVREKYGALVHII